MVVFLHLSTLTTCNQCNLLYTLFDLSTLTTWAINTFRIVLCSFYFSLYSTHHLLLWCIIVVFLYLSTLTTLIQYIVYHNYHPYIYQLKCIFRQSRHETSTFYVTSYAIWSLHFDTHDIYFLLPLTSLIMVQFSIRLDRWNCLSLLYHPAVSNIVLYIVFTYMSWVSKFMVQNVLEIH